MQGFDKKFKDLPDYILKITYQIWEDKDVESIREYYAKGIPVRSPDGVIYGPDTVVKATYATLDEFPDRQLLGAVSYTHLTLPTKRKCRSRWSPYH